MSGDARARSYRPPSGAFFSWVLFAGSESGDPGISVPRVEACSGPDNLDMVSEGFLAVGREAGRSTKNVTHT